MRVIFDDLLSLIIFFLKLMKVFTEAIVPSCSKRGCSETCREIKRETPVLSLFFVLKVGKLNVPFY